MDKFTGIAKKGWHPEKEGTTLKQQAMFWKKDDTPSTRAEGHVSKPLSTLKDPASFGPPPKRTGATGFASSPTTQSTASPTQPSFQGGAHQAGQVQVPVDSTAAAPAPPPRGPWKMDTTGLSTAHLPPPPGRAGGVSPTNAAPPSCSAQGKPGPPSLPPRLPPRGSSPSASQPAQTPATPQTGYINQAAAGRLGAAGISVPGFGIGASQADSNATATPAEGTSFAQKQAAVRTAANLRQDPSSVPVSDMRSAASTANNFRQRHGDQVAAGVRNAKGLDKKYGLGDKVGQYAGSSAPGSSVSTHPVVGKKPPPPVPVKKGGLAEAVQSSHQAGDDAPPPVPASTRPQF